MGPNAWESLIGDRSTLPLPPKVDGPFSDGGFDAIAGFSETDIYCVGGKGDAWRYDGTRWQVCPVGTDMQFWSVCCAGDGLVYIGMQSGSVLRGRENDWEVIHQDEMTLPFKDMVWFDGKVWCTSDYGLWVIENGQLSEADVPPGVKACSGNLSVGDGLMLLAGMYGASVYGGGRRQRLPWGGPPLPPAGSASCEAPSSSPQFAPPFSRRRWARPAPRALVGERRDRRVMPQYGAAAA